MQMNLPEALTACGATLLHPFSSEQARLTVTGIATDSRKVRPGNMFFCILGEHSDGHNHAASAIKAGAAAIVGQYNPFKSESSMDLQQTPVLLVEDSVKALGRMANYWRKHFSGKVVGITGTAGKTTAKEILANVLSRKGLTAKNYLNLNTQIGLPFSMLETTGQEDFWVFEVGISHTNDMDELGPILEPDLAIILNVGAAHTEWLGAKGVAYHKAALLRYLAPGGQALVSADYSELVKEVCNILPKPIFFTVNNKQENYRAAYLGLNEHERGRFRLWLDRDELELCSDLSGAYGAENIIAVAAAAHLLGMAPNEIACGIESAVLPAQRFTRREAPGWVIIDDTYNANPLSCRRILETVQELSVTRRLVCVMGEMLELGAISDEVHLNLGSQLAKIGTAAVFWVGGQANLVEEGLRIGGYAGIFQALNHDQAALKPDSLTAAFCTNFAAFAAENPDPRQGLILFKGSRGNQMENLVAAFCDYCGQNTLIGENHAI